MMLRELFMHLPPYNHLRHTKRSDLKDGADTHDSRTQQDTLLPAKRIADSTD